MNSIPQSKTVIHSIGIANQHWNSLLNQIAKSGHEPRVTILLANIMIEYYMNEILIIRKKLKSHKQKIKYENKINLLDKELEITARITQNIKRFYELRNAYAHQIDIDWKWVINRIDLMCNQFPNAEFSTMPKHRYNKVLPMVVQELAGKYMAVLVRMDQAHHKRIASMRKLAKKRSKN